MAVNFPEGTQNFPSKLVDYDYAQSGAEESFAVGNADYPRTTYIVQVEFKNNSDITFLNARINWGCSDVNEEVGFSWYYRSGTSGGWTRLTQNNATGDVLSSREGVVNATHNDTWDAMPGGQVAVMNVWVNMNTTGVYQFCPGVSGNGSTSSTMYINRFASNSSGSDWDVISNSSCSAFVYEAP